MSEKLKPCMCGCDDVRTWVATGARDAYPPEAVIRCFGCGLKLEDSTPQDLPRLIKQWNHRPGEATARREALEDLKTHFIESPPVAGGVIQEIDRVMNKLLEAPNAE